MMKKGELQFDNLKSPSLTFPVVVDGISMAYDASIFLSEMSF